MTDAARQHEAMDDQLDYSESADSPDSPNGEMRRVREQGAADRAAMQTEGA